VAGRIRENIATVASAAGGSTTGISVSLADLIEPGDATTALARLASADPVAVGAGAAEAPLGPASEGILSILVEINTGVVELVRGFGVPVTEEPAMVESQRPSKEPR